MKTIPFLSRSIRAAAAVSLLIAATGCNPHPHPPDAVAAPVSAPKEGKDTPIHPHNPHTHPADDQMMGNPAPHQ